MNVTVPIPDELARRLGSSEALARRALEAFALEEYRAERVSRSELRRLLGFETRFELDGFLKDHGLIEAIDIEEFDRQMRDMDGLGL